MKHADMLRFLATGIGSLPHNNVNSALDDIAKTFHNVSFWPQLPAFGREEDMLVQFTKGIPGLVHDKEEDRYFIDSTSEAFFMDLEELMIDYETIVEGENFTNLDKYGLLPDSSKAFAPWLDRIKNEQPLVLKGQITGPFTFSTTLTDSEKKCAFYDETLRETLIKVLTLKALWQIVQFRKACPKAEIIISLDEPSMSQYGSSAFLTVTKQDITSSINAVTEVIHKFDAHSFVHCCGNTDWTLVTSSNVDILNFDAYNYADTLGLYIDDLIKFIDKGGFIAWGLIPTLDPAQLQETNIDKLSDKFEEITTKLSEKALDKKKVVSQSMITPSCGMSLLTIEQAQRAINLTVDLAKVLKDRYIK